MALQKFEWVGQSMFWPPKISTIGPPPQKEWASGQNLCQIACEHHEICKFSNIFACGGLIRVELMPLQIFLL